MNVLFDMETGDPDDLITLLLLLNNPDVTLKGVTCYQGSPIQIGLINHVLNLAKLDNPIPVGGWNTEEPSELTPYYTEVLGQWQSQDAIFTPVEVFNQVVSDDVYVLTGAPLSNLKTVLDNLPDLTIKNMVTQGGYLGSVVPEEKRLAKFKGREAFRTYNLGNDLEAFDAVNHSDAIESLTFVTKDLCHGFCYNPDIHKTIEFGQSPVSRLLKKCLARYAENGKSKAMHDPLAMLVMIYPELGLTKPIQMNYHIDDRGHPVFSSVEVESKTRALVEYDEVEAWSKFSQLCNGNELQSSSKNRI